MQQTKTTATAPAQLTPEEINAVIAKAFGAPAADVLLPVKASAEVFGWLDAIFQSIGDEANKEHPSRLQLEALAKAGAFIASFHDDSTAYQYDQIADSLSDAGIDVRGLA